MSRDWRRCAVVALVVTGCSEGAPPPQVEDTLPVIAASATGSKSDCLTDGLWKECSALMRLERSGFAVRSESLTVVREDRLLIAGKRLPIARGEIRFFIYADSGSRARDQKHLDSTQFISANANPTIIHKRTLLANANILVLMDVASEANRERIANAFLAGAPQPPRPLP
jgi:hypothetical protein